MLSLRLSSSSSYLCPKAEEAAKDNDKITMTTGIKLERGIGCHSVACFFTLFPCSGLFFFLLFQRHPLNPVPSTIKYSKKALMHLLEAIRSLLPHHSREISIAFRKPPHCCIRTVVAGDVPASAAHVIAAECCYFVLMLAKGTMTITKCFLSFSTLR